MSRASVRHLMALVLGIAALASSEAYAQGRPGSTAILSAETVPLGASFELRVSVSVPPRSAVYFPDELPATESIESHGRVHWEVQAVGDGARLTLTYPLVALGTGNVRVPGFDVLTGQLDQVSGGALLPGGSVIGAWSHAPGNNNVSSVLASVAPREVRVASIFELEGVLAGVGPMPAADVVGRNWHLPSLALMFVCSSVLIGVLVMTARRWLSSRSGSDGAAMAHSSSVEEARRGALRELDALLALGLHRDGRVREFYAATSGIVRRYVERFDPRWGPDLTSSELMGSLRRLGDGELARGLSVEMSAAEVVKFGPLRQETSAAAEVHWRALRRWIEESQSAIRDA